MKKIITVALAALSLSIAAPAQAGGLEDLLARNNTSFADLYNDSQERGLTSGIKRPLSTSSRGICVGMTDAYVAIHNNIVDMDLDASLELAAIHDAYQAYVSESKRMGCW